MAVAERFVPAISAATMVEVDRLMTERYGVHLMQMMENAGAHLARLAIRRFARQIAAGRAIVVLAGTGGNGGGALVCARHLHNQGIPVRVALTKSPVEYAGVPAHQLRIVERLGIDVSTGPPSHNTNPDDEPGVIVDGMVGYSLHGVLTGVARELVEWTHTIDSTLLSLDIPSGLDATSGHAIGPVVRAAATMTLALPKTGLATPGAELVAGDLFLADIGVPPEVYQDLGIDLPEPPMFAGGPVVNLDRGGPDDAGTPRFIAHSVRMEETHG